MKQVPLAMALAAALAYVVAGPGAPDQDAMRLQQEINTLKYKLDYETDRLERRVETLERQFRQSEFRQSVPRVARAPLVVPVPLGNELTARRLVVTDAAGNARVVLAVSERYGPMLGLLNQRGDVVGLLSAPETGARLELFDGGATQRVFLGLEADAVLELRDAAGEVSVRLPGPGQ